MSDGANFGISAQRALETILGGQPQPAEEEKATPLETLLRVAVAKPTSYEGCADTVCRAVLRVFTLHPESRNWSAENTYIYKDKDGNEVPKETVYSYKGDMAELMASLEFVTVGPDLFATTKESATDDERSAMEGMTGFQWGFAVNCARYIVGEMPVHNPAFLQIGPPDERD